MASATREPEIVEQEVSPTLPAATGGSVDVQVATARRFPRSITSFIRRATEMATLTPEIAASCVYAIPRGGKTIEGPSARLAEIVAHAWGNLRIQAGAGDNDGTFISARGEAWDVESNVAIAFEVRRRITTRKGDTYDDDMITVTGNAAASIALRNAVFKAVPSSFWKPIYLECRQVIAGDARTFASRRDNMLKLFAVMGVTEERLCAGIGVKGKADVTLDHMVTLTGVYNALKEGETTIEDAFPEGGGMGTTPQPAQRKSAQTNGAAQSESRPPAPAVAPSPAPAPANAEREEPARAEPGGTSPAYIGAIVDVKETNGAAVIKLSTGFRCGTRKADLIAAAKALNGTGTLVELSAKPAKDAKYAPTLEEIIPVGGAQ